MNICRYLLFCALGLATFIAVTVTSTHRTEAQTLIGPGQSYGAVPSFAGTGLSGDYYYFSSNSIGDLAQGDALVSSASGPTGTFTTTNICFPDCVGTPFNTSSGGLAAFTNGNATNINFLIPSNQIPTTGFFQTVLQMNGFLAITAPGTYSFSINSDDGSELMIGNSLIDLDDGIHGQQIVTNSVHFSAAGLYAIAIDYFQNGGGAGLDLTATNQAGACYLGCPNGSGGALPNSLFYSEGQLQGAPAPVVGGGVPSLIVGLGIMLVARLRRMSSRRQTGRFYQRRFGWHLWWS